MNFIVVCYRCWYGTCQSTVVVVAVVVIFVVVVVVRQMCVVEMVAPIFVYDAVLNN